MLISKRDVRARISTVSLALPFAPRCMYCSIWGYRARSKGIWYHFSRKHFSWPNVLFVCLFGSVGVDGGVAVLTLAMIELKHLPTARIALPRYVCLILTMGCVQIQTWMKKLLRRLGRMRLCVCVLLMALYRFEVRAKALATFMKSIFTLFAFSFTHTHCATPAPHSYLSRFWDGFLYRLDA